MILLKKSIREGTDYHILNKVNPDEYYRLKY